MKTMRLRHLATVMNSNVDKVIDPAEIPVRLCNYVDVYNNDFIHPDLEFSEGSATRKEIDRFGLRAGDVIITKDSEDRFDIGVPAYVRQTADDLVCGYHLSLVRAKPAVMRGDFLFWALQSQQARDAFSNVAFGVTRYGLTLGGIKNVAVNRPDLETQETIANFLDRETAHIDLQTEKKTRFIALLKEKRLAVITHAVTKGIDSDVRMKDSGLDWLGKIPAHWHIVPPTALFTESKERSREGDQLLSATQKYGVIPLAEFEELEQRHVTLAVANLEKRKHVEIGDFVISMRSMDGGLERARASGSVRSSYSVLKPGPHVEGRFYGALLKSSLYIQALRLTSNFIRDGQDMNFSHFRKVRLPKLDVQEQATIADHIEVETGRIDSLITLTQRSIDRLHEFRAALISAAVTGQIDVATLGKQGKTDRHLDKIEEEMAADPDDGEPMEARI